MRTARVKRSVMSLKTLIGVTIFAGTTVAAVGQEEPTNQTPKPTLADVQHLAQIYIMVTFARFVLHVSEISCEISVRGCITFT